MAALLDPQGSGRAVEVGPDQMVSLEWIPAVVARSTVYGMASACELVSQWPTELRRPWLVIVADAPVRPPQAARFYVRAVRGRTAGVAYVRYLTRLRTVVSATEVLTDPTVARAGAALRHRMSATVPTQ